MSVILSPSSNQVQRDMGVTRPHSRDLVVGIFSLRRDSAFYKKQFGSTPPSYHSLPFSLGGDVPVIFQSGPRPSQVPSTIACPPPLLPLRLGSCLAPTSFLLGNWNPASAPPPSLCDSRTGDLRHMGGPPWKGRPPMEWWA
jgi:hypothetical protein